MVPKSERIELRLEAQTIDRLDKWRADRPDLPSRSEAVRTLLEVALGRPQDDQVFQLTRLTILIAARTPEAAKALDHSYVFAWDRGVYPLLNESAQFHRPFGQFFAITEEMVDELSKYLDARWLEGKAPSFYKLEDHYKVRYSRTPWDRSSLMAVCRYLYLQNAFDKAFWEALLKGSDHPIEARSITRKFDLSEISIG